MPETAQRLDAISAVLGISVDVVGLILAIVAMLVSPRLRKPAIVVALALTLALLIRGGWALLPKYGSDAMADGRWTADEFRRNMAIGNLASSVLWGAVHAFLIAAAFCWRGSRGTEPAAPMFAPPTGHLSSPLSGGLHGAPMPPLSAGTRVGLMLTFGIFGSVLTIIAIVVGQERRQEPVAFVLLGLGFLLSIAGVVIVFMTLHAIWATIQPPPRGRGIAGLARATPAAAVGLLFVPLFNFYWAFHAIPGLATDLNRTLDQAGLPGVRASRGLGIAWCVCAVFAWIPYVGILIGLAGAVIVPMFFSRAINAANALRLAEVAPPVLSPREGAGGASTA